MTVSACPIATISAPINAVWAVLSDPAHYDETRVTFGRDCTFPPGWRGRMIERLPAGQCHRGVENGLAKLKQRVEEGV